MSSVTSIVFKPGNATSDPRDHYRRVSLDSANLVSGYGIEGDRKGGNPKRNLNIMSHETLETLREEGFSTSPGQMGEQIVIQGLDMGILAVGDRLKIGDAAIVEVISHRTGCQRFEHIQGKTAHQAAGRMGVMVKVVTGGPISVGNPVKKVMNSDISSGIANINGARLYYEVKGSGYPLLLVHAGVADSRMWEAQFEAFSQEHQVIRFDLRGFGRSNMPAGSFSNHEDVRALLDFLGIETVYLLGISFGGMIALDFTLTHPDCVKALVLGAPSVSGASPSERIRQFWEEEDAALEKGDLEGATELNLGLWVDGPHRDAAQVSPEVRELVREMQLNIFSKEIPDDVEEIDLEPPAIERLGEIEIPVQVLVGELDLEEKIDVADRLVREIPDCKRVVIPGVAHMLNMEKPDEFNHNVLDFLSTHAS